MKNIVWILALTLSIFISAQAKEVNFGAPVDESILVDISTILSSPKVYLDKTVTVSGMIVGVCNKRGCWMDLASDTKFEKLRIKVRDGDMVFPLTAKGRQALAMGTLKAIQLNLEQTRHYKESLAKRMGENFESAAITEPMAIYQISPVGVKILD